MWRKYDETRRPEVGDWIWNHARDGGRLDPVYRVETVAWTSDWNGVEYFACDVEGCTERDPKHTIHVGAVECETYKRPIFVNHDAQPQTTLCTATIHLQLHQGMWMVPNVAVASSASRVLEQAVAGYIADTHIRVELSREDWTMLAESWEGVGAPIPLRRRIGAVLVECWPPEEAEARPEPVWKKYSAERPPRVGDVVRSSTMTERCIREVEGTSGYLQLEGYGGHHASCLEYRDGTTTPELECVGTSTSPSIKQGPWPFCVGDPVTVDGQRGFDIVCDLGDYVDVRMLGVVYRQRRDKVKLDVDQKRFQNEMERIIANAPTPNSQPITDAIDDAHAFTTTISNPLLQPPPLTLESLRRADAALKRELDIITLGQMLPRALFNLRLHDEAKQKAELGKNINGSIILNLDRHTWAEAIDHVLGVMWEKTKLDVRKECEEEAKKIVEELKRL